MNEYARLGVAVDIYMEVIASARDAAAHVFAIILEIKYEQSLAVVKISDLSDPAKHIFPLLRRYHELGRGIVSYRHIVEIHRELHALVYLYLYKLRTRHGLTVSRAGRGPQRGWR